MNIKRMALAAAIMAVLIMAVPVLAGCGSTAKYSDPIAENMLVSMNNGDFAGFSRDFDSNLKAEVTENFFTDLCASISGQLGKYIEDSKKMTGFNIENGITTATYQVDFENQEDFQMRFVYQKVGGEMKLAGFWFDG
jgi:outer membrane murein-binding lipoprotein Lpp